MAKRDERPYRPCVGAMILNGEGLVLVGRRTGGPENADRGHEWQMPQGGIDEGEDPFEAALREVYEETNIRSITLLAEAPAWYSYDIPDAIAGKGWTRKYRGQTQKWFAFRFTGPESEIDIASPGGGRHKPEFEAWRWEPMARLPELIVPFKRPVYESVVAAFRRLAP
jgi:putative (di)nucleoside polyphosphate hydrolase